MAHGKSQDVRYLLGKAPCVRALLDIALIGRSAENAFAAELPRPVTPAQYAVLQYLANFDKRPMITTLADVLRVSQPTMSSTIRRLAVRELVEIVPSSSDRRAKAVSLTEKGHATKLQCDEAVLPLLRRMSRSVDADVWDEIAPLLRTLRIAMGTFGRT